MKAGRTSLVGLTSQWSSAFGTARGFFHSMQNMLPELVVRGTLPIGFKIGRAAVGVVGGFADGVVDSAKQLESLTTSEGWNAMGQGMGNLGLMLNLSSSQGIMMKTQLAINATNYASNIPNMPPGEIGHDLGYGIEKIGEGVLLSKGTRLVGGATKNFLSFNANGGYGVKLGSRIELMYRNPSRNVGGTIFSYKSPAGKFRLDFHSGDIIKHKAVLHYHTNFGGRALSPHRSLNPFNFGKSIKF